MCGEGDREGITQLLYQNRARMHAVKECGGREAMRPAELDDTIGENIGRHTLEAKDDGIAADG